MKINVVGVGSLALLGSLGTRALAEPFASHGTLAVGVEHVFGVDYTSMSTKDPGETQESTDSTTSFSLLGHMPVADAMATIGSIPRFSLDVFLGPGISVGGGLMYQHVGDSSKSAGSNTTRDTSVGYYLFAPRVGFGIPINERIAIWPRAGISYLYTSTETPTTQNGATTQVKGTAGLWFTTIDALLLISPVEHVAFNVGPALDVLIGGPTVTRDGTGVAAPEMSMYSIGLNAGLSVWF